MFADQVAFVPSCPQHLVDTAIHRAPNISIRFPGDAYTIRCWYRLWLDGWSFPSHPFLFRSGWSKGFSALSTDFRLVVARDAAALDLLSASVTKDLLLPSDVKRSPYACVQRPLDLFDRHPHPLPTMNSFSKAFIFNPIDEKPLVRIPTLRSSASASVPACIPSSA